MATSFNKFTPRKIDKDSPGHSENEPAGDIPDHLLDSDLPVTAEEASQLLERVRQEEENHHKITSLEERNRELEEQVATRDTSICDVMNDLRKVISSIQQEALNKILLDVDDILKEACHDRLAPIIEQRINDMMKTYSTSSFHANASTLAHLGLSVIEEDNSLPDNIIRCSPSGGNGHDFIIEVPGP